jgi:cytochrome c oxidase subunit 4
MSAHDIAIEPHHGGTTKLFTMVWLYLLVLTGIEIFLAYERLAVVLMLVLLIGLSLVKSALIVAYFMHLRFERLGVFLLLIPAMVFCICMMLIWFFPDSLRLMELRPH